MTLGEARFHTASRAPSLVYSFAAQPNLGPNLGKEHRLELPR